MSDKFWGPVKSGYLGRLAISPWEGFPGNLPWAALFLSGQASAPPPPRPEDTESATLHMDDVDVRKALEILSREGSLNILVSPSVTGRVTANLKGLSPDQAFDAVLKLSNLVAQREKGIVYVYTREEVNKGGELPLRVYRLNYIRSTDLEKMIKPFLSERGKLTTSPPSAVGIQSGVQGTGGGPAAAGGALAPSGGAPPSAGGASSGGDALAGGEVVVIQDRETVLQAIDQVVTQLDVPPLQVLIEAVILNVTLDKNREFGVNFGVVDTARGVLTVIGNGATVNAAVGFDPLRVLTAEGFVRGNVGRGFAADEHGLKFGFVDKDVTGFIRALATIGKIEVLATPRLLVLNKQRAELQLGNRLGYATFSQSQVSTIQQVQFLNVGTQLRVRPFVSSDGMVRMEIHPERSSGQVINNIPQTSTAEVTTNIMVPDGATIVIGGLMETEDNKQQTGLPYLSDLPWIGALFRQRQHTTTKKELVVLLTPRIWNPGGPQGPGEPLAQASAVQAGTTAAMLHLPQTPHLALSVREPADQVQVGQEVVYEIQITNQGQEAAQDVSVTATFPPGLHPVGAEGPTGRCIDEQRVAYQPLEYLEPQAQAIYRVQVHTLLSGPQRIRLQLGSPSLPENLEVEGETQVVPVPAAAAKPGVPPAPPRN